MRQPAARTRPEQVAPGPAPFKAALAARDARAAVAAILDLEAAIAQWSADTTQSDETDRARAALRGLILRLGNATADGLRDPAEREPNRRHTARDLTRRASSPSRATATSSNA